MIRNVSKRNKRSLKCNTQIWDSLNLNCENVSCFMGEHPQLNLHHKKQFPLVYFEENNSVFFKRLFPVKHIRDEWVTYQFSYVISHNDANNMTPTHLSIAYYMCHFKIFDKIDSFLINVSNKKSILESLNLHIIVSYLSFFFSLPLWIPRENIEETI